MGILGFLFVSLHPQCVEAMTKNLYIISGCNGAGKTTASYTVLPEILDCREFVNADEIARGLSPFNPQAIFSSCSCLPLIIGLYMTIVVLTA